MKFPVVSFQFPIRTPKIKMAIVLLVLAIFAITNFPSLSLVVRLFVLLLAALTIEFVFWKIRGIHPFAPSAAVVSALIIFLLADNPPPAYYETSIMPYETPWTLLILATIASIAIKQFVRPANFHIFNPAGSGLLITGIFGLPITWWGVGWGNIPLLVTLLGAGFVSLFTIRQHRIIFSFLATSLLVSIFYLGDFGQSANQLLVGSFWFFALVMLPEPMTAAKLPNTRILYGIVVAIFPFLLARFNLPIEALIAALLLGNLLTRIIEDFSKSVQGTKS